MKIRIGTRGSLLARTQAGQIAKEIEQASCRECELVFITTQGDQQTEKPLWQMEGNNFFTKELDEALTAKKVDLVIHSHKDLGHIRPSEIMIGAVTKRAFAHDILFIRKDLIAKLSEMKELKVGTSSPRRTVNIKELPKYLPRGEHLKITTEVLRGNVNTRLKKLGEGKYDAIILALAGLERLAHCEDAMKEITLSLEGLDFMVLPLKVFPSAASQGALAIEVLKSRIEEFNFLEKITDKKTQEEVSREREAFISYGGGCHLSVGIHVRRIGESHFLHIHKGETENKKIEFYQIEPAQKKLHGAYFLGKTNIEIKPIDVSFTSSEPFHLFVTSKHTLHALQTFSGQSHIWCSGEKTWQELTKRGHWVNGAGDGDAQEMVKELLESKFLKYFFKKTKKTFTLTHEGATDSVGELVATYTHEINPHIQEPKAKYFFWSGPKQFDIYTELFPSIKNAEHFSGPGKTYKHLNKKGMKVTMVAGPAEFLKLFEGV